MQMHRTGRLPVSSLVLALAWVLAVVAFVLLTMRLPAGTAPSHSSASGSSHRA
jgi:hypothetical protein